MNLNLNLNSNSIPSSNCSTNPPSTFTSTSTSASTSTSTAPTLIFQTADPNSISYSSSDSHSHPHPDSNSTSNSYPISPHHSDWSVFPNQLLRLSFGYLPQPPAELSRSLRQVCQHWGDASRSYSGMMDRHLHARVEDWMPHPELHQPHSASRLSSSCPQSVVFLQLEPPSETHSHSHSQVQSSPQLQSTEHQMQHLAHNHSSYTSSIYSNTSILPNASPLTNCASIHLAAPRAISASASVNLPVQLPPPPRPNSSEILSNFDLSNQEVDLLPNPLTPPLTEANANYSFAPSNSQHLDSLRTPSPEFAYAAIRPDSPFLDGGV